MRWNPFTSRRFSDEHTRHLKILEKERDLLRQKVESLETALSQCDCLPVPPQALRVRVGGWEETDHFLGVGRKIFWDLKRLTQVVERSFDSFTSILDFGCGCGRVTRYWHPAPGQSVVGTDIDPESIAWCKPYLPHIAAFTVNDPFPPLRYPAETFDLVYSVSVFTHLPEDMQFQWLEELRRIIKPQGFLVTSVHGESLFSIGDPELTKQFKRDGFLYLKGDGTLGLPDFYQTAFHAHSYIEKRWTRFFTIRHLQTRAINNHQDGIVCQRTS